MSAESGLVSIILPFHNARQFLAETVDSVLAQTFERWELVLTDDGATDGSTEIARWYAADRPDRIRYVEHAGHGNFGVTRTRNFGARLSRGEYLAFLDSDDVWLPGKLDHMVAALHDNPDAGLAYGPSEYWTEWDEANTETNHTPPVAPAGLYRPPELLLSTYPFGQHGAPCPSSFLLRRSAFEKVGGFVEEFRPGTFQLYEDTAFLAKIYLHVPVFVTTVCTDRYRCHASSIWHRTKRTTREELERRFYFQWLRRYLREQQITSSEILQAVRRVAWPYWGALPPTLTGLMRRIGSRTTR